VGTGCSEGVCEAVLRVSGRGAECQPVKSLSTTDSEHDQHQALIELILKVRLRWFSDKQTGKIK
jgi:hypothetical protein